jgi:hypothetical protein
LVQAGVVRHVPPADPNGGSKHAPIRQQPGLPVVAAQRFPNARSTAVMVVFPLLSFSECSQMRPHGASLHARVGSTQAQ